MASLPKYLTFTSVRGGVNEDISASRINTETYPFPLRVQATKLSPSRNVWKCDGDIYGILAALLLRLYLCSIRFVVYLTSSGIWCFLRKNTMVSVWRISHYEDSNSSDENEVTNKGIVYALFSISQKLGARETLRSLFCSVSIVSSRRRSFTMYTIICYFKRTCQAFVNNQISIFYSK